MRRYRKKFTRPPIPFPVHATTLCGLRTAVALRSCCVQYLDDAGQFREKSISFAAGARLLKWIGNKRLSLPIRVRA